MQIDTRPKTLQSIRRSNFCVFFILPSLLLFMTMLFLFARREFVMLRILLILYAVLLVTAVVVFRRHADQITASISPILETTARYQAGDTRSLCDDTDCTIQEFQMIADNLNNMIHNINRHIELEYKLKIEQKTAEYQALQAEVDPHFLYNILNLFITLNRIGEKRELEQAIIRLSHLFRYTCEHHSSTTLREEFTFIDDYLCLQQIRFGERLSFQCYLEPGLENFSIPKLLIQPLVENAVVHALEPSDLDILIQFSAVTAQRSNQRQFIILSVTNTGPAYCPNAASKRVGIHNLEERLAVYNPNAFLVIDGGKEKPTKCHIMIPITEISAV